MNSLLNSNQKKRLLEISRFTLETYLKDNKIANFTEKDPVLNAKMGAFVTLRKNEGLRGCIGNMISEKPLFLSVRDMSIQSAIYDPRFNPVKIDELADINIEISVLSKLKKIKDPEEIIIGTHGVMVRSQHASGVFLPQVAAETGWDKKTFMNNLCAGKAGLPENAWQKKECDIYIFTAEVFQENNI